MVSMMMPPIPISIRSAIIIPPIIVGTIGIVSAVIRRVTSVISRIVAVVSGPDRYAKAHVVCLRRLSRKSTQSGNGKDQKKNSFHNNCSLVSDVALSVPIHQRLGVE
jgi:hypothetical protein